MRHLVRRLRAAKSLSLLLDYDGTLVPFAPSPDAAAPDDALRAMLGALASRARTKVTIVSGRDRDSLGRWLGDLPIEITAEHGLWRKRADEQTWSVRAAISEEDITVSRALLTKVTSGLGGMIERKRAGAAWHYRGIDVAPETVDEIVARLEEGVTPLGFSVLRGACVVEIRPDGVDKSLAVQSAREDDPAAFIVAVGDDRTDEDMFRALPDGCVGVHVGDGETAAAVRVPDHLAVRELLAALLAQDEHDEQAEHED